MVDVGCGWFDIICWLEVAWAATGTGAALDNEDAGDSDLVL